MRLNSAFCCVVVAPQQRFHGILKSNHPTPRQVINYYEITPRMLHTPLSYALILSPLASLAFPDTGKLATPLDHDRILCPVLAALVKTGDLVPDEFGKELG